MIAPRTSDGDERRDKQVAQYFPALCNLLRVHVGAEKAITLDEITSVLGMPHRRTAEQVIEDCLPLLGFVVVAGAAGYYRPTTADQINRYVGSLHSRHQALQRREKAIVALAKAEGWQHEGDQFIQPPAAQPDLFSMPVSRPQINR